MAAATVAAVSGAASAAGTWTLVDLGTLGGPGSYGAAVSDSGVVVGCADAPNGTVQAFIYRDGTMRGLDGGSGNSCALAVNGAGVAAGRAAGGELVVWNGAAVTRLGVQGDVGGINDAGVVVGSYAEGGSTRAFMYRDGNLTTLGSASGNSSARAINKRGDVVGSSDGRAFLYRDGALRDLGTLGGNNSVARGINERGQVVGMAANAFGQPTPFLYEGAMSELPGGGYASAIGINARAQVVASAEGRHGYVVVNGAVTYLDSLPAVQARGWRKLEPTGINDQGWIVGTGVNEEGNFRAFLLVPRELAEPLFSRRPARSVKAAAR